MNKDMTMLIIGCHKDKKLEATPPKSKYDVFIQAGAALTPERIYPFNDYDGFKGSISDRNHRYSEMTAIYWAHHNVDSKYIGIEHYRRRYDLSDDDLDRIIESGIGFVTVKNFNLGSSIREFMTSEDFHDAFYTMVELVKEFHPEDHALVLELMEQNNFRLCNMNIWRRDIFNRYCNWIFPMLDAFYRRVPEKKDINLRRDVGYAAERLTSFFIEKLIREGIAHEECSFSKYKTSDPGQKTISNYNDRDAFLSDIDNLYKNNKFLECRYCLFTANNAADCAYRDIYGRYILVFLIFSAEMIYRRLSLFEYLPDRFKSDLKTVSDTVLKLRSTILKMVSDPCTETEVSLGDYMKETGFSGIAVGCLMKNIAPSPQYSEYVAAALNEAGLNEAANEVMFSLSTP